MTFYFYIGVICLISVSMVSSVEVNTNSRGHYIYSPLNGTTIKFKVKAMNDAHIIFAQTEIPNNNLNAFPFLEVVIGGWHNKQSVIRRDRREPLKVAAETPGILSNQEFRGFWIKLVGSGIMVGREYESVPFLSWTDPEPITMSHFGVATSYGSKGQWKIEVKGFDFEGYESRCSPGDILVARSPWDGNLLHIVKEACYHALTDHSCNTVEEPDQLSELPPGLLENAAENSQPKKWKNFVLWPEELKTWEEAKAACEARGQHLASVTNMEEQSKLENALRDNTDSYSGIWLAANDKAKLGDFRWFDGTNSTMTYSNWQAGAMPSREPDSDERCVFASALSYVIKEKAYWFTTSCNTLYHYACQIVGTD